jgi:soluble lytic murein transglycosylase-like protein
VGAPGTVVTLLLLVIAVTASASGITLYRIRSGDTLSAIAQRYHTSVARLVALNHLPGNGNLIYAGGLLRVPGGTAAAPAATAAPRAAAWRTVTTSYVVRPGDSLIAIAQRFHVTPTSIAARNRLPRSLMVLIGQRLTIARQVRTAVPAPAVAVAGPHLFSGGSVPSRSQTSAIIAATARRWGVDPRLALAIAWQESGFNQRWVSVTGAVGAMQIMPATGSFVSDFLVHRRLNVYDARDNATAGVALLSVLLRETHGNVAKAVAGYYQGLASVQSRGMYDDTKAYVRSVLALRNRF